MKSSTYLTLTGLLFCRLYSPNVTSVLFLTNFRDIISVLSPQNYDSVTFFQYDNYVRARELSLRVIFRPTELLIQVVFY